jgi:hypothetical protein
MRRTTRAPSLLGDRDPFVIMTAPPIKESSWRLDVCEHHLRLTLDCRIQDRSIDCWSHGPAERSCLRDRRCEEDGVTVRSQGTYALDRPTWYEVTRCGQTAQVAIRCPADASVPCRAEVLSPRKDP